MEYLSRSSREQRAMDIDNCEWLSLLLDESTDVIDIAQVCVFVRMTFSDFSVKEELLTLLQLKGTTKGDDIFNAFMEFAASTKFPLCKVDAMTTDGAPSMTGKQCKKHIDFHLLYALSLNNSQRNPLLVNYRFSARNCH